MPRTASSPRRRREGSARRAARRRTRRVDPAASGAVRLAAHRRGGRPLVGLGGRQALGGSSPAPTTGPAAPGAGRSGRRVAPGDRSASGSHAVVQTIDRSAGGSTRPRRWRTSDIPELRGHGPAVFSAMERSPGARGSVVRPARRAHPGRAHLRRGDRGPRLLFAHPGRIAPPERPVRRWSRTSATPRRRRCSGCSRGASSRRQRSSMGGRRPAAGGRAGPDVRRPSGRNRVGRYVFHLSGPPDVGRL